MITLLYVFATLIAFALYMLPSIIALFACDDKHAICIILLNILTGWTIVGWLATLVWAILAPSRRTP